MIKCWEKRTEAVLPAFFRFRQVSFYIEIFEKFYAKRLQVRKIYLSLHSRLRKTSNTAEHGAVVQLVRMRACHARGRGFEPHPHRLKALHESEGLFRIWHLPKKRTASSHPPREWRCGRACRFVFTPGRSCFSESCRKTC